MNDFSNICAVILAAGKGTRMKSEHPKVAALLNGKALINHVLDSLQESGIRKFVIVVGYKKEEVMQLCAGYKNLSFAVQEEQLGTGHALLCSENELKNFHGNLLVACGDVPLISGSSFYQLVNYHKNQSNYATVLSAEVENSAGYGRLVRDKNANLLEIVEEKDATEIQKQIKEINTGTYVFNSPDVFEKLKSIGTNNAQKEYYLPDLLKIYHSENHKTGAFKLLNHLESSGVNSRDDLERLEIYISQGKVMAV